MERTAVKKYMLTQELAKKARLFEIAGDPTRIRILCFMFENKKGCVSDIADALGMSIASISHHLQIMRDNGLFETERQGNTICYNLTRSDFTKRIEKIICD